MSPSPRPSALAAHVLLQTVWGACNPAAVVAALVLAPSTEVSTNTSAWAPLPLLGLGTLFAAAQFAALLGLLWLTQRGRAPVPAMAWGLHLAQLPFLPYGLLTALAFSGLEGNIIGFIVVPAFLLYLLISAPASLVILVLWVRRCRRAHAAAA